MSEDRRLGAALLASAILHGLLVGAVLATGRGPVRPALVMIPVALVGLPGGGGGAHGPGASPAAEAAPPVAPPAPAPAARPAPPPRPARVATRTPAPARPAAPSPAAVPSAPGGGPAGATAGDGGDGPGGGGDGSGGDGSGGARVAYGANPLPPYPLMARRLGMEGVVLLDVLVAPDGSAADVRVRRSSGFAVLDESASTTVRRRWRFVPARRGDTPIESRVTVPVRFRLAGGAS